MQQLSTAISFLALSQLFLTGLFYFCYFRNSRLGVLVSLLCICLIAAVVNPTIGADFPGLNYFLGRIAAATPAVLWIFAHALFVDDRKISALEWCLLIGYQLARGLATFLDQTSSVEGNAFLTILNNLGLLIAFGLSVHVILMATRELGNDLLEERRRIRGPFAAGLGLVMSLLVASILLPEFMSEADAAQFGQAVVVVSFFLIFIFFLIINLLTFRLTPDSQSIIDSSVLEPYEKPTRKLKLAVFDLELIQELDRRMLQGKLFAESDLTIGQLAKLLEVQEYKLRVIINRELGYRNFNQFLNHYRIDEASQLLAKKSKHRNISIVAQEVGYASLSTFNQAFKKLKGLTPTEYKALKTNEE